jgi:hypothetical protein
MNRALPQCISLTNQSLRTRTWVDIGSTRVSSDLHVAGLFGAISDGRGAAVDRQLHPIHEARIV